MATLFSKIVNGEIPSHKVAEDDRFLAFLDINPLTKGHTLVIPKKEVDYLFDLDENTFLELHRFSKKVAHAIEKAVPCERIGVAVMGLEVPHAHIHLVPINKEGDLNFSNSKLSLGDDELGAIAEKIRSNFSR